MIVSPDVVTIGRLPESAHPASGLPALHPIVVTAQLVGARIRTKDAAECPDVARAVAATGLVFVFRFGVIVTFAPRGAVPADIAGACAPYVEDPTADQEPESAELLIAPGEGDQIRPEGCIVLAAGSGERLLLVATVLARSAILNRDEAMVAAAFDATEPMVEDLRANGRVRMPIRAVMRLVGAVLAARHRVTGMVQVDERPDVLWDNPQLDRLYARLENEYELKERAGVLDRKFAALGDFADTLVEIVQDKRAVRLEAAVILLIAFEIALNLLGAMH